jgi:CDP-diacylglycerol--serine O-phosphatidyltransferase
MWLRLFWVIGAIYVSCTALRLARFNVRNKHDPLSHMSFRGMPSPGAAAVVAASVIFFETLRLPNPRAWFHLSQPLQEDLRWVFPYLLPLVLLIAALLMVSRFQYSHLINRFLRGRRRFRTLVGFFFLVMIIVWEPDAAVLVAIYLYALSAPTSWLFRKITGRQVVPPAKT